MANVINCHEYKDSYVERYDEVYETRQYISGFIFGFSTEYRKDLVDFKERIVKTEKRKIPLDITAQKYH